MYRAILLKIIERSRRVTWSKVITRSNTVVELKIITRSKTVARLKTPQPKEGRWRLFVTKLLHQGQPHLTTVSPKSQAWKMIHRKIKHHHNPTTPPVKILRQRLISPPQRLCSKINHGSTHNRDVISTLTKFLSGHLSQNRKT